MRRTQCCEITHFKPPSFETVNPYTLFPEQGLCPCLVSWIGLVLKVLTEGHSDWHHFDVNCKDFLQQFRISRRASLHFSKLHATTSHQDRSMLLLRRRAGTRPSVFWWKLCGTWSRLMRFAAHSSELGRYLASQVDTRRSQRRLFQEVTAGNTLCVFCLLRF